MAGKGPLITIGIPTFNRANLLGRAIESILNQDYKNIELIISDNASTDATKSICKVYAAADPRLKYFQQTKNMGPGDNYFEVLKKASGSFFMWLGDDDWIDSNYVSSTLQVLERDQTVALASGSSRYYRNGEKVKDGDAFELLYKAWWLRVIVYFWKVTDNSIFYGLMRKSQIIQVGLKKMMGGDWMIIARIAAFGKIVILEETSVHRELGGATTSYRNIAKTCGFPTLQGVFPFTSTAINALLDIISGEASYKTYSISQRLLVGFTVFFTILLKAILTYSPSLRNFAARFLKTYQRRNA